LALRVDSGPEREKFAKDNAQTLRTPSGAKTQR
jgi:hypothetical protein